MVLQMSLRAQNNAEMVLASETKVLEILKRAKQFQSGEGVSFLESEVNVREEAIRRSHRAGHCNKNGGPVDSGKIWSSCGFGETKLNLWPRDEAGNLIN